MHRGGSPAPALAAPALGGGGDIMVAYPAAAGGLDSHLQGVVPKPGTGMGALPNLIYYAGVARGTVFLAEHSNPDPATDTDTAAAGSAATAAAARAACVATLERVGALHSRYTFTARGRTLTCLMDDGFAFCALADAALPASDAAKFLAAVREAFWKLLEWRGLPPDAAGLAPLSLDADFGPFLRRLGAHYVGVPVPLPPPEPQPEEDAAAGAGPGPSSSGGVVSPPQSPPALETTALTGPPPSVPPPALSGGKAKKKKSGAAAAVPCGPLSPLRKPDKRNKVKDHGHHGHGHHHHVVTQSREIVFDQQHHHHPPYPPQQQQQQQQQQQGPGGGMGMAALEVVVAGPSGSGDGGGPNGHAAAARAGAKGGYHHQMAQRTWWRNVRIVLVLDALVCVILFSVWLGICNGFHCLKDRRA